MAGNRSFDDGVDASTLLDFEADAERCGFDGPNGLVLEAVDPLPPGT